MKRGLGYKPDMPSEKDHTFAARRVALPRTLILGEYVDDVLDQGSANSCTANATMQGLRMLDRIAGIQMTPLRSRLHAYFWARRYIGDQDRDEGTYIRDICRAGLQFGSPFESLWAYDLEKINLEPTFEAAPDAYAMRAEYNYQRIGSTGNARLLDIKTAITLGHPVVFGTDVSNEFTTSGRFTKLLRPPKPADVAGGHALLAMGFDGDEFIICGSYGVEHGNAGFYRMSSEYMMDPRTSDLWALVKA